MARDLTPIHPELREAAAKFPRLNIARWNIRPLRFLMRLQPARKLPDAVGVTQVYIPREDGQRIRLRIYTPTAKVSPAPAMVWMHGGGMIIGNPEMSDVFLSRAVVETGMVVVSVDYRLAPDVRFPIPLEDCYAALKWTAASAEPLGIDPNRIAVGGQSAGGGLAASLAQLAHDRGEVRPAFQLLVYPMLDDRSTLKTDIKHPELMTWTQANNRLGWESYLGQAVGAKDTPLHAVPARRDDLSGLPPAWIGVGTLDLFHEEDVAYGERLKAAGVECELVVLSGVYHGFDAFDDTQIPLVEMFQQSQIAALKRHVVGQ